ncbi:hypothetical protein ZIOFF_028167 [Zingiber officinale]|uniref:Pentatricopeptide repeat-containing protein n=1 Tax=Zingiber officinale TaxID=94328 RepID=A0A8J5GRM1_ZINOF|nr:hypothetical protein ZIOFF_028167 [Zingiber officinale]
MTFCEIPTDADSYVLLVESFLKKNEPADARTALDSMKEQGHLPSPTFFCSVSLIEKGMKENMDLVYKILEALLMRDHIEEALGGINLMTMNDCIPDIYHLLVVLCDNDNITEAQKLADFTLEERQR